MWVGGGTHFSFMNQPKAAGKNYKALVQSLVTLMMHDNGADNVCIGTSANRTAAILKLNALGSAFDAHSQAAVHAVIGAKLGLNPLPSPTTLTFESMSLQQESLASKLWSDLEPLMKESAVDWTIFWRQLAYAARTATETCGSSVTVAVASNEALIALAKSFLPQSESSSSKIGEAEDGHDECASWASRGKCDSDPVDMLQNCPASCRKLRDVRRRALGQFPLSLQDDHAVSGALMNAWLEWLQRWLNHKPDYGVMLLASPKYVPREWMLAEAYVKATSALRSPGETTPNTFAEIRLLQQVFRNPYTEQSAEIEKRFYRRPPNGLERQGGIGFMS